MLREREREREYGKDIEEGSWEENEILRSINTRIWIICIGCALHSAA
jgi:hypothetical protein